MIRDKRKVSPGGTADKPAEPMEPNGSEAGPEAGPEAGSKPKASEPGTDKVTAEKPAAGKPAADQAGEAKTAAAAEAKAAEAPEAIVPPEVEPAEAEAVAVESAEVGELRSALDERTADLQRLAAEFANYRKRVERQRVQDAEAAVGAMLSQVIDVLDDIDRARDHGDLTGPFAAVAEKLTTVTAKLGLTAFGAKGDAFDPNRHEAVAHQTSSEVTEPTCIQIMRRGYLLGERLLRPALVAVADPESE